MSGEAELPERPEPRGTVDWLRLGAVVVAGALGLFLVGHFLGPPLDSLAATWGLPRRMSLSNGAVVGTAVLWSSCVIREWTRPARRFLSAHGLPKSDR